MKTPAAADRAHFLLKGVLDLRRLRGDLQITEWQGGYRHREPVGVISLPLLLAVIEVFSKEIVIIL
jgi:hypothetical protein